MCAFSRLENCNFPFPTVKAGAFWQVCCVRLVICVRVGFLFWATSEGLGKDRELVRAQPLEFFPNPSVHLTGSPTVPGNRVGNTANLLGRTRGAKRRVHLLSCSANT